MTITYTTFYNCLLQVEIKFFSDDFLIVPKVEPKFSSQTCVTNLLKEPTLRHSVVTIISFEKDL